MPQLQQMKPSYIGIIAGSSKAKKLLLAQIMERSINRTDAINKHIKANYQGEIVFPNDFDSFHP